jgi:intracellular septation protein A
VTPSTTSPPGARARRGAACWRLVGNGERLAEVKAVIGIVRWILRDFGPLIVFYGTNHFFGFVPAIVAGMVWAVGDVAYVKITGQKVSAFLWFSSVVTLGFGVVDLYVQGPFLLRYEAVLSNVVTGVFFGLTLRADKTIIQEFAERRAKASGKEIPINPDTVHYFRLCSAVWTGYFFLKATAYAWIGYRFDLEHALAIRVVIGNATFYPLLAGSIFLARPIIRWLRRTGRAPSTREHAAPEPARVVSGEEPPP